MGTRVCDLCLSGDVVAAWLVHRYRVFVLCWDGGVVAAWLVHTIDLGRDN